MNKIYKVNSNKKTCFNYFFNTESKHNPLKDDIYELQKNISDREGQTIKDSLLKYYYDNDFLDLTLTFIDGHIIAYFGKESFQKLKHSTRNTILKSLEVFNFSDKRGRIFYFRADHDVEGMQKNIEKLLGAVKKIISLDKVKILVFDRGGFSDNLFNKLNQKFNIKFITLAVKNKTIQKQIDDITKKNRFQKSSAKSRTEFIQCSLKIGETNYRTLLIRNNDDRKIHPFITNMTIDELSNDELILYYSMHWRQEQEHNAFGKIGGNMHSKTLQDIEFEDTTNVNKTVRLSNKIAKLNSNLIKLEQELKRIEGLKISVTSRIKPKSKRTDNKLVKKQILDYANRVKQIMIDIASIKGEIGNLQTKLDRIPSFPTKKKYKYGPIDYSISITNLANNLNSRLVEIATNGEKKFQLATLMGSFYSISAEVQEDEQNIFVKYCDVRQRSQITMVQNLCNYFNPLDIKLRGKNLIFSINSNKTVGKIRNANVGGL